MSALALACTVRLALAYTAHHSSQGQDVTVVKSTGLSGCRPLRPLCCMFLSKASHFPRFQFSHLWNGDENSTCLPCIITTGINCDIICQAPSTVLGRRKRSVSVSFYYYWPLHRGQWEGCLWCLPGNGQRGTPMFSMPLPVSSDVDTLLAPSWRDFTFLSSWLPRLLGRLVEKLLLGCFKSILLLIDMQDQS